MDMQSLIDEVRLKLTGDVLDLELTDSSLIKVVNSCLREVQRYIDTVAVITIPYSKCIDLTQYKVHSVVAVKRAEGYVSNENIDDNASLVVDPMYASQWQILTGLGNMGRMNDYAYNYASWNTVMQIQNTVSTDLSFYFDKLSNKLYINVSATHPQNITVMFIPRFDDVSQIVSDFWIDILTRMVVATTKIIVGRVRSKYTQSNALWTLDGSTLLQEGTTELSALREELKASTQLVYGID